MSMWCLNCRDYVETERDGSGCEALTVCSDCGHTDLVAEEPDEDEPNNDCTMCGGSGGGEGYWRCPACRGTGRGRVVFGREYEG